jgi:hypothetical protein
MRLIDSCASCKHLEYGGEDNMPHSVKIPVCKEIFRDKDSRSTNPDEITNPAILCGIPIEYFGCWFYKRK